MSDELKTYSFVEVYEQLAAAENEDGIKGLLMAYYATTLDEGGPYAASLIFFRLLKHIEGAALGKFVREDVMGEPERDSEIEMFARWTNATGVEDEVDAEELKGRVDLADMEPEGGVQ